MTMLSINTNTNVEFFPELLCCKQEYGRVYATPIFRKRINSVLMMRLDSISKRMTGEIGD